MSETLTYILFSPSRAGWMTRIGNYSSDVNAARRMTREEALATVTQRKAAGQYTLLPINLEDLK